MMHIYIGIMLMWFTGIMLLWFIFSVVLPKDTILVIYKIRIMLNSIEAII